MRKFICLALFLCSPSLFAGTVYQWVSKDGSVIYSDEPPPGVEAKEITIPDQQVQPSASPRGRVDEQRRQKLIDSSREINRQTDSRIEQRKVLQKKLREAREELKAAEQALVEGEAPKGGERIANVGGGTRLAPAYHQRLVSLKADVQRAEEKVKALRKQLRDLGR